MALPKKYSNQYLSSEGVVMETEPNGEVVIKQIPQTPDELPTVSDIDNGKVLKVVEGAWAAATAPAGGGGLLKIEATYDEGESTLTLDKTWTEINAAWEEGVLPLLVNAGQGIGYFNGVDHESGELVIYTVSFCFLSDGTTLDFGCGDADDYPVYYYNDGGGDDGPISM